MAITNNSINNAVVANNFSMPNTNAAGTNGVINFGGVPWINNYGGNNTNVGANAGPAIGSASVNNTQIGANSGNGNAGGANCTYIGYKAGFYADGSNAIAIGANSNPGNNGYNIVIGNGAGITGGGLATSNTVIIGGNAFTSCSLSTGSIAIGYQALNTITGGDYNISIGVNSGSAYTSTESYNILIANAGVISESNVMRLGTNGSGAQQINTTYIAGAIIGAQSITASTSLTATSGNITATSGNLVLTAATTASVGQITQAGTPILHTFDAQSIFVGPGAGNFTMTAVTNTAIGYQASASLTSGNANSAVGNKALNKVTSGIGNVAVGSLAGTVLTTGASNVAIGMNALKAETTGSSSVAVGHSALILQALSTGFNTAIGESSLVAVTTGTQNIALGYNSGSAYTSSESSNIVIGNMGVAAESNVIRIGTAGSGAGQQSTCYIAGITGVTVTGTAVLCSATGLLGTVVSSIRYKENIQDMANDSSPILSLRPVTFNYISDETKTRKSGLIAEEVEKVMPDLVFYNANNEIESVKYQDLSVLLLNEIQKLNARIKLLEEELGV